MSRRRKMILVVLVGVAAILAAASPHLLRRVAFSRAKAMARSQFNKLTPDERRKIDAVPAFVVLPSAASNEPLTCESMAATTQEGGYDIRFPAALSVEHQGGWLVLTYPRFQAVLHHPASLTSADADFQRLVHLDYFNYKSRVNHARPDDIDTQPDLESLKMLIIFLTEKSAISLPRYAYFAEFNQGDRRGTIEAGDEKLTRLFSIIEFPKTHVGCGVRFENPGGVDPLDAQRFIAAVSVNATGPPSASKSEGQAEGRFAAALASTAPSTASATAAATPDQDSLLDYVKSLGLVMSRITRDQDGCVLEFDTTTARLARFLQGLDSTNHPIRQDAMTITTLKPGVDNLKVELHLTLGVPKRTGVPLACLRDVTALFPAQGNTIWATSFSVDDTHRNWELAGTCTAAQYAGDLLTAMMNAPHFQQPKLTVEPSKSKDGEFSFTLTFVYQPGAN